MKSDPVEIRRLREAFASLSEAARPREDCPAPERLWEAVAGSLPAEEVEELVIHTLACPACAESWRLGARLAGVESAASESQTTSTAVQEAGRAGQGEVLHGPWPLYHYRKWLLAAAAVVLVVVGINFLKRPDVADPVPVFRSARDAGIRSLLPEGQILSPDRVVLRWSPGPEGSRYNIQVAAEDLRVLASARGLAEAEYAVPESTLSGLPAGARLVWQVEVLAPDGTRRTSATFLNQLE